MPHRRSTFAAVALAFALAACAAGPATVGGPSRSPAPAKRSAPPPSTAPAAPASVAADPTGAPTDAPAAIPTASPASGLAPAGPTVALRGRLRIDPGYLLDLGLAARGGGLLSDQGVSVTRSGEVLVEDAAGAIISNNGGSLISDNGGGLTGKTKYLLARALAQAAPDGLAPIARMGVRAVSLRTGAALGAPTLTDADGAFALAVPAGLAGTIRVVARVPQTGPDDPRWGDPKLAYDVLVTPPEAEGQPAVEVAIDEDSRVTTRYLRQSTAGKLGYLISGDNFGSDANFTDPAYSPEVLALVLGLRAEFAPAVKAAALPAARVPAIAALGADAVLGLIDVQAVEVDPANTVWTDAPPGTRALPALQATVAEVRAAAAAKLAADPAWFEGRPWFQAANLGRATPWKIARATDFTDFFVANYLMGDGYDFEATPAVMDDLGFARGPDGRHPQLVKIVGAGKSIFLAFAIAIATRPEAKAEVLRVIEAG